MKSPRQIHIDHKLNLLQFLLLQFLRYEHPMIAHKHVDRSRLLDRALDGVVVPDVSTEDVDVTPCGELDGFLGFFELADVAGEEGDVSALVGAELGQGQADAAGAAGDEHVAVLDWDSDGLGADNEVEEEEEEEGEWDEEDQREEGEIHFRHWRADSLWSSRKGENLY